MQRITTQATCPVSESNKVTIAKGPGAVMGIGHPKNVGSCTIYLASYESNGRNIDQCKHIELHPGQGTDWYYPLPGTSFIYMVCHKDCQGGTAILEYDAPVS